MDISAHDNQAGIDLSSPPSTSGPNAARIFDVPLLRATAANLGAMGRPVTDFATAGCDITPWPLKGWRAAAPGTGVEGGVVEGVFTNARCGRVQYSVNVGLGRRYVTGWYGGDPAAAAGDAAAGEPAPRLSRAHRASILTHEANYHADGGQVICARPGGPPIVLLLAPAGDDVTPASFRAFLVDPAHDGTTGVHIHAGTWHQPAFPAYDGDGDDADGGGDADCDDGAAQGAVLDNRQGAVHSCVGVSFTTEFGGYLRVPLTRRALADPPPPPPPSPAPPRLGYAILYVPDPPASLAFYAAAFGVRTRFSTPDGTYGEAETGGTTLAFAGVGLARSNLAGGPAADFAPASPAAPPPGMEVALVVPDVDAAVARALAAGATLAAGARAKPWGQRVAYVRDRDGFLVELCTAMG
jgi:catechol 2,3-dioxygenase-like lactoylglutathione lyase family enzyme